MIIGKNIDLRPITLSDAEFILSLRLDPELSQYLSPVENNLDKQREWLHSCLQDLTQHYFIIQNKQQQPVGTIRIYDIKNNSFCWGSWIVIPEARSYASFESIILVYQYAFFDLGLDITHFDVRKKNTKALNFYLRFGAVITHENDQDFFLTYTKENFFDKKPLASIIITSYNHEKFIAAAIESALAQDYRNTEIIISDDASTDNTVKIAQHYADSHPTKIKLLTAVKNRGATKNWYKAVEHCTGKYITALSGDDTILPQKISKQVAVMEKNPEITICYADAVVVDVSTQKIRYRLSDKSPTKSGSIHTALADSLYYSPTIMFRRQFAPKENLFSNIIHASDLAYYKHVMILSAPNGKIYYLPEVLYFYNKHDANLTVLRNTENHKEHIKAIQILQNAYPEYKHYLAPSIYDFSCVGFFKNIMRGQFKNSYYFLKLGLSASRYNPFKFLRALVWAVKFLCCTTVNLSERA